MLTSVKRSTMPSTEGVTPNAAASFETTKMFDFSSFKLMQPPVIRMRANAATGQVIQSWPVDDDGFKKLIPMSDRSSGPADVEAL